MSSTPIDTKPPADASKESGLIPLQQASKSTIIDHELNQHGMGRYQWFIWVICGTGLLLDVMWTQAFSLASPSIQHEFGFSDKEYGNIASAYTAGVTAGAFVWGALADVAGRRVAFHGTSLVAGVFGMCLGAMHSYNGLLVITALTGFGVGGNLPIDSTITAEYLPAERFYLLAALSIFQPLGVLMSTLIAYGLVPNYTCPTNLMSCRLTDGVKPCCSRDSNMGWRYLYFTVSSITLGVFIIRFIIFPFHESPRFLLSKGNDRAAVNVIRKIAAFNKRSCDLTVESLYERSRDPEAPATERMPGFPKRLVSEISRLKVLFTSWRMIRLTILVWFAWMFDYWGFSIAVSFLPTILQRKNSAIHVSLEQTYVDYIIIAVPGVAAVIISVLMVRASTIGRKGALVSSSMFMGLSLFLYSLANTQASHVGFNVLENFCQSLFNAVASVLFLLARSLKRMRTLSKLFGWTPEAFPSAVRGTATGLASFFANLFAISAPLIAAQLFARSTGSNAVLYLAGTGPFISAIALLCIPTRDMVAPR